MIEVTICFSFSIWDGHRETVLSYLDILHGLSTVGNRSTESVNFVSANALKLLEQIAQISDGVSIEAPTLGERIVPINLDDLEANTSAYAKRK